jgi:hypothetical protein
MQYFQVGGVVPNTRADNTSPHSILFLDSNKAIKKMIIKAASGVSYTVEGIEGNISVILLNILSMIYYTFDICYPALYGILKVVDDLCLKGFHRYSEESSQPKRRRIGQGKTRSRLETKKTPDCVSKFLKSYFAFLDKMNLQL